MESIGTILLLDLIAGTHGVRGSSLHVILRLIHMGGGGGVPRYM